MIVVKTWFPKAAWTDGCPNHSALFIVSGSFGVARETAGRAQQFPLVIPDIESLSVHPVAFLSGQAEVCQETFAQYSHAKC